MQRAVQYASPDDIDIAQLWSAIVRNRMRLLMAVLAAGAITFLVLSMMTPRYMSSARILISNDETAYTRRRGEEQRGGESVKIDADEVASQVEVVRSRDLLLKVAHDLHLERNPEFNPVIASRGLLGMLSSLVGSGAELQRMSEDERLLTSFEERLTVYPVAKTRAIVIEVTSADPKLAAAIANALAAAYIESNRLGQLRVDSDASTWIGGRIDELKRDAEAAAAELEKFRAQSGLLSGANNTSITSQQLSDLNTQLVAMRNRRTEAESRLKIVRQMLAEGAVDAAPDLLRSTTMQRLIEQRVRIERQIGELSATLLPAHPRMRQLAAELNSVKRQIRQEGGKMARSLENEVDVAVVGEADFEKRIAALNAEVARSSDAQAKLDVLQREANSKRELYETYLGRYNDATTRSDTRAVPANAKLLSSAMPSNVPEFPKTLPITLLVMAGTLLAGLAFIVTRELLTGARSGGARAAMQPMVRPAPATSRVAGVAGKPGPIRVPQAASGPGISPKPAPVAPERMPVRFGTADEAARYVTLHAQGLPGYRILVTSEDGALDPSEESVALSRALAAGGAKVVLIDRCFNRSTLGSLFGLSDQAGFAELIRGEATFEDVVRSDPVGGIHLISAGRAGGPVPEEERRGAMLVLDALDEIYQYVVVVADNANAVRFFEALGGHFDAGLLVDADMAGRGAGEAQGFLGFEVPGLETIRLARQAAARGKGAPEKRRQPMPRPIGETPTVAAAPAGAPATTAG
ncbi:MAG: exopolysaccharide transport family protein [Hyphomicrobiaceae bacterium]